MRTILKVILPLAAVVLTAGAVGAEEKCGVCHPEERVTHEVSIHAREEITCTSCHGGVAGSLDADQAHGGEFHALTRRRDVPASCAECHSDLERMRPYNLPVDQYALYQTSAHGRAVARGDERAAICIDCHTVHDVRSPRDPKSAVYPRNLPATCGACHGDRELMEEFGLDPDVVTDYRSSIHGRTLFEAGNLAAPNCTSCHGVHGAAPPGGSDVDKLCGACHVQTRHAYTEGRHHDAMEAAGLSECVSCHSNHAIQPHRAEEIGPLCLECHEEGSEQVRIGTEIRALIDGAEEGLREAEELVVEAEKVPLHVEDQEARLEEARTYLTEALTLAHQVDREVIRELTDRVEAIGEEVQHELRVDLDQRVQYLGLAIFWFYLAITLAILWNAKRRISREQAES